METAKLWTRSLDIRLVLQRAAGRSGCRSLFGHVLAQSTVHSLRGWKQLVQVWMNYDHVRTFTITLGIFAAHARLNKGGRVLFSQCVFLIAHRLVARVRSLTSRRSI